MNYKVWILAPIIILAILCYQCKSDDDTEAQSEICNNALDDDGDGFVDCEDDDCADFECACDDGIDNDGDGFIDLEDSDCN